MSLARTGSGIVELIHGLAATEVEVDDCDWVSLRSSGSVAKAFEQVAPINAANTIGRLMFRMSMSASLDTRSVRGGVKKCE